MKNLKELSLNEMKRTEGGFAWWWTILAENSTNFWTIDMFADGKRPREIIQKIPITKNGIQIINKKSLWHIKLT